MSKITVGRAVSEKSSDCGSWGQKGKWRREVSRILEAMVRVIQPCPKKCSDLDLIRELTTRISGQMKVSDILF